MLQPRPDAADPAACEKIAVGLLARREHSRRELARKLQTRGFEADTIAQVLERLEGGRLLDEGRFVERFVESRIARGAGPVRIRAELAERGIGSAAAVEAINDAECDWAALAVQARRKHFGGMLPADFAERARQMRFLQNRGFDARQIEHAVTTAEGAAD